MKPYTPKDLDNGVNDERGTFLREKPFFKSRFKGPTLFETGFVYAPYIPTFIEKAA